MSLLEQLYVLAREGCKSIDEASKLLNLSPATAAKRLELLRWLFPEGPPTSPEEFRARLVRRILEELKIADAIRKLFEWRAPLTPHALVMACRTIGVRIDEELARGVISLLRELELISFRRVPVLTLDEESAILEYLLARGRVRFRELRRRFLNARRLVISLWKRGLVRIEGLEEETGLSPELVEDPDSIPLDRVRGESRFIDVVEESGVVTCVLRIPDDVLVEVRSYEST